MKIDKFFMKSGYSHYKYRQVRRKVNKFLIQDMKDLSPKYISASAYRGVGRQTYLARESLWANGLLKITMVVIGVINQS